MVSNGLEFLSTISKAREGNMSPAGINKVVENPFGRESKLWLHGYNTDHTRVIAGYPYIEELSNWGEFVYFYTKFDNSGTLTDFEASRFSSDDENVRMERFLFDSSGNTRGYGINTYADMHVAGGWRGGKRLRLLSAMEANLEKDQYLHLSYLGDFSLQGIKPNATDYASCYAVFTGNSDAKIADVRCYSTGNGKSLDSSTTVSPIQFLSSKPSVVPTKPLESRMTSKSVMSERPDIESVKLLFESGLQQDDRIRRCRSVMLMPLVSS